MKKYASVILTIFLFSWLLSRCSNADHTEVTAQEPQLEWRNHHDTVGYVGIAICSTCHHDIQHTFSHTGMGMSFGAATPEKAFFDWDGSVIISDPHSDYQYKPFFRGEQLMVTEFKLEQGDTVFKRTQLVDYIIGSGQHTNSHIFNVNGYLYQAPFTYYTQTGRADLPPGFEDGNNSRFSRQIGLECMSCHNAMPTGFVKGSRNRFSDVPMGIDCERCHGPGELHVSEKMKGILVDTSTVADNSIVNPRRLSQDRQVEICQRCHLQGNAVLQPGKSFFDFRPGMVLSDVMDVYLPRYDDSDENFIMASHVDRFKLSQCFVQSNGAFNCISCHNPHVSVRETATSQFNQTCSNCHSNKSELNLCSEDLEVREKVGDNCVSCHMPLSGAEDIPHVAVHDHWIRKPTQQETTAGVERTLQALVAINNPLPSNRSRARAFAQQFEQFEGETSLLDSAWKYVNKLDEWESLSERVHIMYLRNSPALIVQMVDRLGRQLVMDRLTSTSYDNRDAWTAYRIGNAYSKLEFTDNGRAFYAKATALAPDILEFENVYGTASLKVGDIQSAEASFSKLIKANPYMPEGYGNMGYVQLLYGDTTDAVAQFEAALALDPEYDPARLNLISSLMSRKEWERAKEIMIPLMERYPNNERYISVWNQLKQLTK